MTGAMTQSEIVTWLRNFQRDNKAGRGVTMKEWIGPTGIAYHTLFGILTKGRMTVEQQYALTLHIRDWENGVWVPKRIKVPMSKSRVIMVRPENPKPKIEAMCHVKIGKDGPKLTTRMMNVRDYSDRSR